MSDQSRGHLLVVDDEEMNRDMLSRRLEVEGYTVATASGGAEATQIMEEQEFDAILLDVMMPVQNGFEVLAEIRKSYTSLELPILMVTAKVRNEDMINAFSVGANDYITKPINFPVALARISSHVASKQLSNRMRREEAKFVFAEPGINSGIWDWDLLTDLVTFSVGSNADSTSTLSESADDWFGRIHTEDLPRVMLAIDSHRQGYAKRCECEYRIRLEEGAFQWVVLRSSVVCDTSNQQIRMAGSQTTLSRRQSADPLTGLPNRTLFLEHLSAAVNLSRVQCDFLLAVLFLDLDRFKFINDNLGHHSGDEVLVEVARRLESCLRDSDVISRMDECGTIARLGGDEFVVLLKGINHPENASHVAERILKVLAEPIQLKETTVSVSASVGIAVGSRASGAPEELLRDADAAMYRAKSNGKSCYCVFDQKMRVQAARQMALELELSEGMALGHLQVYYQPIVSLQSGLIDGFEALLRWSHPTRGLISAGDFITIAEKSGGIVELGAWALHEACQQLNAWQLGHPHLTHTYMCVNISAKQFFDPEFSDRVQECLEMTGLAAHYLKLEIPENALMRDLELATKILKKLYNIGVRFSLDDFGRGYSSLSYLQQFPIDTIKIDRSFIAEMEESVQSEDIVKTIVAVAHGLGMNVTATGVDRLSQLSILRDVGCETGQGFLYAQPAPNSMIEALLNGSEMINGRLPWRETDGGRGSSKKVAEGSGQRVVS